LVIDKEDQEKGDHELRGIQRVNSGDKKGADMNDEVIKIENISKIYRTEEVEVHALRTMNLTIKKGAFTAIAGPSGSGKTTLLNVMSGLDVPTSGRVLLANRPISEMKGGELSDFRRDHIGFIFQSYNLIPVLTVRENIEYIMLLQGVSEGERRLRVSSILRQVGLEGMEDRLPKNLSGGQQQRVAVARAMVSKPDIILADEPTANLDSHTGSLLLDIMRELNETTGMSFVFSTHDNMIMERAKRLVVLKDGEVVSDEARV
jgi:putative ABC transport system ATP-binding protein